MESLNLEIEKILNEEQRALGNMDLIGCNYKRFKAGKNFLVLNKNVVFFACS